MTGFLHRLAERATGAVHPLRKAATNLFAPPLLEEVQPQTDALEPARIDSFPAPLLREEATPAPSGQRATENVSNPPAQTDEARHEVTVDQVRMDHRPAVSETSRDTPIRHPATEPPPLMPRVSNSVQSVAAWAAPRTGPPLPTQHVMNEELAESLLPASAAIARVEPLLPLNQPTANLARPTVNASRTDSGRAPAGRFEETTEVHVSIGRIEVTAVHEPAPAKPVAPRRNAPMSLDDYLAKRHGGRP